MATAGAAPNATIYGYGNENENVGQFDCNNLPSGRWRHFVFPVAFNAIATAVSAAAHLQSARFCQGLCAAARMSVVFGQANAMFHVLFCFGMWELGAGCCWRLETVLRVLAVSPCFSATHIQPPSSLFVTFLAGRRRHRKLFKF